MLNVLWFFFLIVLISISAKMFHPMQRVLGSCRAQMMSCGICFFPAAAHGIVAGFLPSFSVSWLAVVPGGKFDCRKEAGICLLMANIPFHFLPYFSHFLSNFILLRWHFVFVLVDITYLTRLVF